MKKCLIISLITIILVLGAWITPVKAATGSVGISSTSVTVGNTVSVTIYFGEKVKAAQCTVNYDTSKFSYNGSISGGAQFNASDHTVVYLNPSYKADLSSVTLSFTANATGAANFSVGGLKVATATQTNVAPNMANTSVSTTVKPKPDPKPPVTNPDNDKPSTGTNPGSSGGSTNSGSSSKPNNNNNSNATTKKPTFQSKTATVYAKETVSIRESWDAGSKLLGTLQKDKSITRTGIGSNGWDRVNYNGRVAYINSQYLTTTKPKEEKKDKDEDKDKDKNNTTNETNNTVNNETVNNEVNNIENQEENSQENNLVSNEQQGSNEVKNKGSKNYIEFIIIGVIIAAILVIIISEVVAKKKSKKKGRK